MVEIPYKELAIKAFNLGLLVAGGAYLLRARVRALFQQRRERFDGEIRGAAESLAEAHRRLAAAEQEVAGLEARAAALVEEARSGGEAERRALLERGRRLAELIRANGLKAADTEGAGLRKRLILESLERALAAVREKLPGELGAREQRAYLDDFVDEVAGHG